MACTIEKILTDARTLLERLKEHDTAAESLIDQSAVLHQRVAAMREAGAGWAEKGQGAAAERADPPGLRPPVLLPQENTQIRDLRQENRELWMSLEEHQDALELIMSKYRKQMLQLLQGRKGEDAEPVLKVHQANSLLSCRCSNLFTYFLNNGIQNGILCSGDTFTFRRQWINY